MRTRDSNRKNSGPLKNAYAPDNTRSSVVVVLLLGAAACLVALLVGLSDKPNVATIGIAAGSGSAPAAVEIALDESGQPMSDDELASQNSAAEDTSDGAPASDSAAFSAAAPTIEPSATPQVAAAVEPTAAPSVATVPDSGATTKAAPGNTALAPASGTVEGAFFTRADEDKGAKVTRNSITVSFNEDGTGSFTGALDITYADKTNISLQMSGPLVWSTAPPQVEATVAGSFAIDAPNAADDVSADKAELSITSLESGSGSLCASKCFGFTFPPQNRL